MMIDTESEEGKALVALANLGHWVLHSDYCARYWPEEFDKKIKELGFLEEVTVIKTVERKETRHTALTKLPEGL